VSSNQSELPDYVEINQAAELLGEKPSKVYYHVERSEIGIEPGREQQRIRRYSVADILATKERIQEKRRRAAARRAKPESILLDWMYASDVPAGLKLSMQLYPGEVDLREAAIYQAWRKNNNYLTMAAYSQDRNDCYATIQVVPLPEQIILDVLSGRREESSIDPDEILSYDQPGPYNLLVTSATCLPDRPALLYQVLYKYMQFWIDMYPERWIKRVYAQAVSDDGMRIVQHFFMSPLLSVAYNAFMLDLAYPSPARMIRTFKRHLEDKAPLPDDLRWPPVSPAHTMQPQASTMPIAAGAINDKSPPAKTAVRRSEPRIQASTKPPLPDGWYSVPAFAELHNIAPTTVKKAITSGRFTEVQHGEWKSGRSTPKEALDEMGQRAFYKMYHQHSGFTACPDCPHGWSQEE
jgi:hypothetical protein